MSVQPDLFDAEVLDPGGAAVILPLDRKQMFCVKCKLAQSRLNVVCGEGHMLKPPILFIGEAPGIQEDAVGRPCVGRAGQLLDKMIVAMGLTRDMVYIANCVACRPPKNRQPEPDEIVACSYFLDARIKALQPQTIVALGSTAAKTILRVRKGVADLRGRWHSIGQGQGKIPVRVTYHPAFLLRTEGAQCKGAAWSDLQAVMEKLGLRTRASAP